MKIMVVYYSETGVTKAAAIDMAECFERAGHACSVQSITSADPEKVKQADLICLGCWTAGMFILFQGPRKPYVRFVEKMGALTGKKLVLFCTYKIAAGKMLRKMAAPIQRNGGELVGQFQFRGPAVNREFNAWLESFPTLI